MGRAVGDHGRRERHGSRTTTRPSFAPSPTSSWERSTAPSCSRRSRRSPTRTRSPAWRAGAPSSRRSRRRAATRRAGHARARALRHRRPEAGERRRGPRGGRPRAVRGGRRPGGGRGGPRGRRGGPLRRRRVLRAAADPGTAEEAGAVALDAVRRLEEAGGERISCGVAARTEELTSPADLLRAADEAQYRAKRARDDVDVSWRRPSRRRWREPQGRDRAYRASDPEAALARELLELIDEPNGASRGRAARARARSARTGRLNLKHSSSHPFRGLVRSCTSARNVCSGLMARRLIGVGALALALAVPPVASAGGYGRPARRLALRARRGDGPLRGRGGRGASGASCGRRERGLRRARCSCRAPRS